MKLLQINDHSEVLVQKEILQKTVIEIMILPDELSRILWELFLIKFAEENIEYDIPDNLNFEDFDFYDVSVTLKSNLMATTYNPETFALAKAAVYLKELSNER